MAEAGALGQLVADQAAVLARVHGFETQLAEPHGMRAVQGALHLDALGAHQRGALPGQLLDGELRQRLPALEVPRVGSDRRVHLGGLGQRPVPQILVLDVGEQWRKGFLRVEEAPAEHGARGVLHEADLMAGAPELLQQLGLALELDLGGAVMVEHHELRHVLGKRGGGGHGWSDVREKHEGPRPRRSRPGSPRGRCRRDARSGPFPGEATREPVHHDAVELGGLLLLRPVPALLDLVHLQVGD